MSNSGVWPTNPKLLYELYEYRLARALKREVMPHHVGVILDGNRRWAKAFGSSAMAGHQAGAYKVSEFLGWAREIGVQVVTLWMLSTDNLARDETEIAELLEIIASLVEQLAESGDYEVAVVGDLSLVPDRFAKRLSAAVEGSSSPEGALRVNVAVGYGGRQELVDAVRSLLMEAADEGGSLEQLAESLSHEDITAHLYTKGLPDPDLIIRTSGEQRLSGFLLWQSAHSEYYFCETYWPDFRKVDFLRALRSYTQRERRMGK